MCGDCYEQYGAPTVDTPLVRELEAAIRAVYNHPDGIVGGPLHVILDDWNLESLDDFYDKTIAEWTPLGFADESDGDLKAIATTCLALLRKATLDERASALARAHD